MRRRIAWISVGLLLLVGAGFASTGDIDESANLNPIDQSTEPELPDDVNEPSPEESAKSNTRMDASPLQYLGNRLLRLLTINSLLTTHVPIHLR